MVEKITSALSLVCLVLALVGSPPRPAAAQATQDNYLERIGIALQMPLYHFTSDPILEEGADQIAQLGARVIKLSFDVRCAGPESPCTNRAYMRYYAYNSDWPNVDTMEKLAQTPYFDELFRRADFHTYILVAYDEEGYICDGMDAAELQLTYSRHYALAAYLLRHFRGSGKTFILQSWEGENVMHAFGACSCRRDYSDCPAVVQGMQDSLRERQRAVTDARLLEGEEGVRVRAAAEIGEPDGPMVNLVLDRHTANAPAMDLYSFTAWSADVLWPATLPAALDHIKEHVPDSALYGDRNVYLGEYNCLADARGGSCNAFLQESKARAYTEAALAWGVPYAVYFQLYNNEWFERTIPFQIPPVYNPGVDVQMTFHLIRPDGTRTPTWYYFHALLAPRSYVLDPLDTLAGKKYTNMQLDPTNADLYFDGDASRVTRMTSAPGELVYHAPASIASFSALIYACSTFTDRLRIYASPDGIAWKELAVGYGPPDRTGGCWSRAYFAPAEDLPRRNSYLKIEFLGERKLWSPQLSQIMLFLRP